MNRIIPLVTCIVCACTAQHVGGPHEATPYSRRNLPDTVMDSESPERSSICGLVTLKLTILGQSPGKPPMRNLTLALDVQNPSEVPIWLLLDHVESEVQVRSVWLSGARTPEFAFVWRFDGVDALRVAAQARITFRNIGVSQDQRAATIPVTIAREVRIAGKPAHEWLGRDGLTSSNGTFRVDAPTVTCDTERRRD